MTKETEILQYIRLNPFISQQELADKIGISRSAVAGYIANMTKRGVIRGRAYIIHDEPMITCIGGANVDRKATSDQEVAFYSSNPVHISEACGGVARNIAENLARLNNRVALISAVGDDREGKWLVSDAVRHHIDVSQISTLTSKRTGTYTALINTNGEMVVALADMDIYDHVTVEHMEERWSHIASSHVIFLDTNFPAKVIEYLIRRAHEHNIPVYVDPVSSTKSKRLPQNLLGVTTILPNREEAEALSGKKIATIADCEAAANAILARGVEHVVITLGDEGVYYASNDGHHHLEPYNVKVIDVTGAGDAFASGLLFGVLNNETVKDACQLGLAASALTVQTEQSVSPQLNAKNLYEFVKENE